ncbi:MAG: Gfo/Idh/MocA family oxidoreductase [Actinomycetia bacterium]|nr:Gfo/Idh/MocA family oxidoreductase [Actinomycetes bacterium]MCP5035240.1 Gfo/Idh/MocA family oxidoreductase [Actinomycetes bacterium]
MSHLLRFGVLGAARIAPRALIDPVAKLSGVEVSRVAARDPQRAATFAADHDIAEVSATYAEVIAADDVDIVYNPLPMSLHAEWTIAALRAGKHVLCEKPFASNATEAADMVRVAEEEGRILGEAFHYFYHPLFRRILDEVASGRIGDLVRLEAEFETPVAKPNLRWDYATSGGSLMDLGCYPMHWVRQLAGEEPTVVSASAIEGPAKIDASIEAEMLFPSGVTAQVASSMERGRSTALTIEGTEGRIEVINPLAPQMGNQLTIVTAGGQTSGPIEAGVSYEHMVRAFVDHVVHDAPFPTQGADSIANMAAIDAVYTAAGLPLRGQPSAT